MPIAKAATPRSDPWDVDEALAIAIDAHGPIPAAAIIKPAKVRVGALANITSNAPDVIDKNEKSQIRLRL